MKKILFSLVALVCSMSMNAQITKVMKDGVEVAKYKGADYTVVFEEAPVLGITGTAKATIGGSEVDVEWVQLWENGPRFAVYNVGVTDVKAESYGGYYCWGKSIDKDSNRAYKDGESALTGTDDTATNLWGSNWRMPTQDELKALYNENNCTKTWTTVNGVNGWEFKGMTSTAYADKSVFLPAAGQFDGHPVLPGGDGGYYWSSSPNGRDDALYLRFHSGAAFVSVGGRSYGYSVRAVLSE